MKFQNSINKLLAVFLFILIGSCKENVSTEPKEFDKGELSLDLSLSVAKSIGLNINRVYLEINGPTKLNGFLTISDDTSRAHGTFSGLLPGIYDLEVVTYNSNNDILATGSGSAEVKLGEITVVNIQMTLNTGLSITVNWGGIVFPTDHFLYVANEGDGGGGTTILKILSDGSATVVGTGFDGASGLAVHPVTKDLYVSDDYTGVSWIKEDGTSTQILGDFSNPNALAFDSNNNLLIAGAGGKITRVNLETNSTEVLATGFRLTQGIGEYQGEVFFTDNYGYIYSIQEGESLPIIAPGESNKYISQPLVMGSNGGLTIDNNGNIYICDFDGKIVKVSTLDKMVEILHENLNIESRGLILTPSQDFLLVTNYGLDEILAIDLETNVVSIFADSNSTQGSLNGPFGMVITDVNFAGFTRPTSMQ